MRRRSTARPSRRCRSSRPGEGGRAPAVAIVRRVAETGFSNVRTARFTAEPGMGSADAVAQYQAASAVGDIDALMKTLAPDAELISPLVASAVIRGHKDLRVLMEAVYTTIHDLRWSERLGEDHRVVMLGEAKVGPFRIGDAAVFELAEDGSIQRIRPHLRPWLATTFFALRMLLKVGGHPGLLRRSWRPAYSRSLSPG
jgi:SnoaL-like domain